MRPQVFLHLRCLRQLGIDGIRGKIPHGHPLICGALSGKCRLRLPAPVPQVVLRCPMHPAAEIVMLRHIQPPGRRVFTPAHYVGKLHLILSPAHP